MLNLRITETVGNDLIESLELFGPAKPLVINCDDINIGGQERVSHPNSKLMAILFDLSRTLRSESFFTRLRL